MPRELLMMQNSFEWETIEGQTLEIENAIRSNARDLKIEGNTYQNLLSETKELKNYTYNESTGEYTLTNPSAGAWNTLGISYTRPIQAGEKLLIRVNVIKNTVVTTATSPLKITWSDGTTMTTGFINIENGVTGLFEYYCDGATVNESDRNSIYITTREYTSGELVIKDIQVIPVLSNPLSYTELPTSINGIESVAEREKEDIQNLYTGSDLNVKGRVAWANTSKIISCKPNTNYTFSCNIESINKGYHNANPFIEVYINEKLSTNKIAHLDASGTASFTTNNEAKQLIIYFFVNTATYSSTECEANFKDIELYENNLYPVKINQYNHNYLTHEVTLLDNTTNSIETINGILYYVQNIGKIVLDGTQPLVLHNFTNDTYICATYTDNSFDSVNHNSIYVEGEYKAVSNYIMGNSNTCGFNNRMGNNKGIFMRFPKSEVGVNISQLNNYLKANNHIVYYKLAEPIYIPSNNTNINLPQPLRSLPNNVRDTVEGNKLIQRVGKIIVDGTNDLTLVTVRDNTLRLFLTDSTIKNVNESDLPFLCDSLPKTTSCWSYDVEGIYQGKQNNRFVISISREKGGGTIESVKAYFAANPTTLYYELATPTEQIINVPRISIGKGGNTITTTNNIKPNLSIKYKKAKRKKSTPKPPTNTYLYNSGNEGTELTGGYLTGSNNSSSCNIEKQVDNLYVNCTGKGNFDSICYARTNKTIKPCKLKVNVKMNSITSGTAFCVFLSEKEAINSVSDFDSVLNKRYIGAGNTTQGQYVDLEIDLTDNAEGYFYILCMVAGSTSYICKANINKIEIIR